MTPAFRERDVERGRRFDSVVEKELVEIAHAIKQQRVRRLPFDLKILRHHRRDGGVGQIWRRSVH